MILATIIEGLAFWGILAIGGALGFAMMIGIAAIIKMIKDR